MEGQLKRALVFAVISAALAGPVTGRAQAQQGLPPGMPQGRAPEMAADLLPPHEVTTVIASMGMRPLSRPIWRGDRYVVFAVDRHGQEVRVVLDAHNGQVLAVRPSSRGFAQGGYGQGGYGQGAGAPPYGYDQGYAPPPPQGYPPARQAPYDQRYGATPPPPPGAPPPSDDQDYFDNDGQQGSLPLPPAGARTTSRDPHAREVPTGSVPRRVTAVAPKEKPAKDATPMPRPRPELAKLNDANPGAPKDAAKDAPSDPAKKDVRVIDLGKPKPEAQAEPKPGEAIRF